MPVHLIQVFKYGNHSGLIMGALRVTSWRAACLVVLVLVTASCARASVEPVSDAFSTAAPVAEQTPGATEVSPAVPEPSSPGEHPQRPDTPALLVALDPADIGLPPPDRATLPVNIGIFLTTRMVPMASRAETSWSATDARDQIRRLVQSTNAILAPCTLHVAIETAQVVALPDRLLRIQGNTEGSWGGHPPAGTENPELFNYEQNERLTGDVRALFAYGKQHTSPNTIAVFTVEHIRYYAERELTDAGGLSFPPNVYHHPDDYPFRNSVLLVGNYPPDDGLPTIASRTVLAHELGHMLLNTGDHERDTRNLMSGWGTLLSPEQCERMRGNLDRLFGDAAVPDPGPP